LTYRLMNFSFKLMNTEKHKSALIANKSISVSYDVTSIFDGISQALFKFWQ